MKEEIEKRRAEAAERKKQLEEDESAKPAFAINPKGSSKVRFEGSCICAEKDQNISLPIHIVCSAYKYPSCNC